MKKKLLLLLSYILIFSYGNGHLFAQDSKDLKINYETPQEYTIGGISITGTKFLDTSTLINISGLKKGEKITIPGESISKSIKKLWQQGLFSDVSINISKYQGEIIFLNISLIENNRLSSFKFIGNLTKNDISTLKDQLKLMRGKILSENLINISIQKIRTYFVDKGFYNVKISYDLEEDPNLISSSSLIFTINKEKKIKIKEIVFHGRQLRKNENKNFFNKSDMVFALNQKTLKRNMKETKEKKWWRIFKISKYIEENYKDDLRKIISKYNEKGFRDAQIIKDTSYLNDDNTLTIEISIYEGDQYRFRNISFVGNTVYSNERLNKILSIKSGDIFDKSILDAQIYGNPNGGDISSLYLDDGYLFFNVNLIETAVENNQIDLEIRIYEGQQAKINKVTVNGNIKTNDHVIMREIRTKPGDLFSRSDIIRTQRELAQLSYFNPESLGNIDINPDAIRNTVDINYTVEEVSSDKINLQGGWGAGRVIGQLGLEFNNFSFKNIANFKKWDPLPSGDGQRLILSASSNGVYYQNYNMSFIEPWLGGKKPTSLNISLYKNIFSNGLEEEERESTEITGVSIGLGQRLKYPDDYFSYQNSLNLQQYKLTNSQSFFSFNNGTSNNINLNTVLGRNSVDQLIFPRRGSNFSISLKLTPPYSLFQNIDDYNSLTDQEKFKFMEFYKWNYKSTWYSALTEKLVLATRIEMGLLGAYNSKIGIPPFERFYLGGDGLSGMGYMFDGRELIALRGYSNNSVSPETGGSIYNKYTAELRYAVSLNPTSTVYILGFLEAGNSWGNFDYYNPFSMKRSAGIGVRITIPMMGLMGLDYGWGYDDIPGDPDANGGQFHFSIGQNF